MVFTAVGSLNQTKSGLYILEGSVRSDGNAYEPKQLLIAKDSKLCAFEMEADSTVYIFGGEPFPEERYIDWNLVSSSKDCFNQARETGSSSAFCCPPEKSIIFLVPSGIDGVSIVS